MLKRSKTDEIDLAVGGGGSTILVVNDDADACELVARLVESAGWPAARKTDLGGVGATLAAGSFGGVVIDSLSCGVTEAFKVLDEIRGGGGSVRDLPVVILASSDTNRLFAYQSGADGFVVRPFHSDELLDAVGLVMGRSADERADWRRAQLMGGANTA